jgi:MYXO-CTERM domain-containing protein
MVTCLALLAPRMARAQMGGGGLSASDFSFYLESFDPGRKQWVQMTPTQQSYFFNRARCECAGEVSNYSGHVRIVIQPAANTPQKITTLLSMNGVPMGDGRLYAGSNGVNCLNPDAYVGSIAGDCTNLLDPASFTESFPLTEFLSKRVYDSPPIPVAWLYGSTRSCGATGTCDATRTCTTAFSSLRVYFWARTTGNNYPDATDLSFLVNLAGEVPYSPSNVAAVGGNESLVVNWSWPAGISPSADANFLGVQIFCQREPGAQAFKTGTYAPAYMTSALLCPDVAPATAASGAFGNFDPKYLCSGLLPATATSHRLTGLQNGIAYRVGVAAIDRYGNISEISDVVSAIPNLSSTPTDHIVLASGCSYSPSGPHGSGRGLACLGLLAIGLFFVVRRRR